MQCFRREIKAANIRKARKVDKAAILDDFKSGLIESKAFKVSFFIHFPRYFFWFQNDNAYFFPSQHREEMRGRDDCQIDDVDKNNYVYEK